jgi:benzoyl-CoA reductase/2-hydroxyglutaryl-CoA dehydratase subunit BcrC/BadD/HgdB
MTALQPLSESDARRTIGLTTTVPVEMVYAAGLRPLDLNNVFITSGISGRLVEEAEQHGFPRNSCAWNKGLYSTAARLGLRRLVAVVQGDCSNTHALSEVLAADGVEIVPFAFPYSPDDSLILNLELDRFAERLGTDRPAAESWKPRLDELRALAHRIDELAWREGRVGGEELHLWTISTSDFLGDPERYRREAAEVIRDAERREPDEARIRLALIGIPPICEGFFGFLEAHGARVVFNEIPRQFAMPCATKDLLEQYSRYTYPYDIFVRLRDIKEQLALRRVRGVIHYVQSFCFRQVQDTLIRRELDLPILTLEGDRPGPVDMRTQTRIEAFIEMLRDG